MELIRKCRLLFSLNGRTLLLLAEATIIAGWIRFYLLYFPFARLAPSLGDHMKETNDEYNKADRVAIARVRQAVDMMSRNTFWETKCLVRAITAMRMLERRNIESTLYLGTAKDESGKFIAHAWLRSGSLYVTGAEEMNRFVTTGTFARFIP